MPWVRVIVVFLIAVWAMPASAQSLAAVARKEDARRKQQKQPSKVITNKDLRPVTTPPAPVEAPAAAPTPNPEGTPAGQPPPPDEAQQREQDEQAWRNKMADARQALDRSQMYADALQSKINALWADFTARDNPVERAKIELERNKAIAEQARVKGEIEAQTKAIADLEEEARRAGIPPGWIR